MTELWALLLLGLGLVFVLLEVFFPSFGLLGTLAASSVIGGGVLAWKVGSSFFWIYLALAFVLLPAIAMVGLKLFPRTPVGRLLTLGGSSFDPRQAAAGGGQDLAGVVGRSGVADTALRPAGKALIDGRRLDVVTRGELIDRGRSVVVLRVEGNKVVVAENGPRA